MCTARCDYRCCALHKMNALLSRDQVCPSQSFIVKREADRHSTTFASRSGYPTAQIRNAKTLTKWIQSGSKRQKLKFLEEVACGTRDVNATRSSTLAILDSLHDARRFRAFRTICALVRVHDLLTVTCFGDLCHNLFLLGCSVARRADGLHGQNIVRLELQYRRKEIAPLRRAATLQLVVYMMVLVQIGLKAELTGPVRLGP